MCIRDRIVAYSQGFDQIAAAESEYGWDIDLAAVAKVWRAGCIIRARFLDEIAAAYTAGGGKDEVPLLLAAPHFRASVEHSIPGLRRIVAQAALHGVAVPAFAASLAYYDGVRVPRLPAALIQGQRDYFGSHTYARVDRPGVFHIRWETDGSEEQLR